MTTLNFRCDRPSGSTAVSFTARRMVNLGYVGRNQAAVRAHIDELAREGVPPPVSIPLFIPLPLNNLVTEREIQVVGPSTSGEVEVAFLINGDSVLLGIGSDHTDRALERTSMGLSKMASPNVIGDTVWDIRDVADHWDDLVLRSFVRTKPGAPEERYQEAKLGTLMSAKELMDFALARLPRDANRGLVLYSGTIPVLGGHGFVYGSDFRAELVDERLKRTLSVSYQVQVIANAWDEAPTLASKA